MKSAKKLTIELDGADQIVKRWFFRLPQSKLKHILSAYEEAYGSVPRNYAAKVIPQWRKGEVKMSGLVAERLFKLLPHFMPPRIRYQIAERLWLRFSPSSKKTLSIRQDANLEEVSTKVRDFVEDIVTCYRIPRKMERRFDWISADDVGIKQDLLNHLRLVERDIAVSSAQHHLPVLLQHLQSDIGAHTSRAVHVLKVGRHELELILERGVEGVEETKPSQTLSLPVPAASLSDRAAVAPWKLGRWPLALAVLFAVILLMLAAG